MLLMLGSIASGCLGSKDDSGQSDGDGGDDGGSDPPPPSDTDGDGVIDDDDQCPDTPSGAEVDAVGCELPPAPGDEDGDGINDDLDLCAGTPAWAQVDADGCKLPLRFENWMHPNSVENKFAMFNNTEQWDQTLAGIDGFGFFIGEIDDDRINLSTMVQVLQANDVAIVVEGGGTLNFGGCDDQNGENSATIELNKIQRIYDAGGKVDYYTMDGPISRVIEGGRNNNCGFTLNQSIEELVDYMQTMHAAHPDIGIGLLSNFPNWAYGGIEAYQCNNTNWGGGIDYHDVLEAAIAAVEAAGEEFAYYVADNPWGYASGTHNSVCSHDVSEIDWMGRILALETQVQSHGIPFGLTYNSELGGNSDNATFYNETLEYIGAYQTYGGSPDIRNIESWYPYPTENMPEEESYTYSNLMLAALAILEDE